MNINANNFKEQFPLLQKCLDEADYVAFDCEFSGLDRTKGESRDGSAADAGDEIMNRLCSSAQTFSVIQLGLCCIRLLPNKLQAECIPFTIDISPALPDCLRCTRRCQYDAQTIDFLLNHGFDFTNHLANGVRYVTEMEETFIRSQVDAMNKAIGQPMTLDETASQAVRVARKNIQAWLAQKTPVSSFCNVDAPNRYIQKAVHQLVETEFPQLHTISKRTFIQVRKQEHSASATENAVSGNPAQQRIARKKERILTCLEEHIGCRKVWDHLMKLKVPFVFHNGFADLMYLVCTFCAAPSLQSVQSERPPIIPPKQLLSSVRQHFTRVYDTALLYTRSPLLSDFVAGGPADLQTLAALVHTSSMSLHTGDSSSSGEDKQSSDSQLPLDAGPWSQAMNRRSSHEAAAILQQSVS
ncbi:CAF1 family ribonuclease [Schizosaccharomyces japonicus yFS275]|uniref:CAF1 family ribonuclease n=1 Tax=Schizosaccharomyces japonicus (strain yFS275 / FY16936) TaxID=402676 RepID=B6JZ14_SCHJY|nr:CAF1 family ribonuclease [Schizosaccharomyces japonicus yFS275]EEB06782.1 CAF1 family ribonuclease [Schizosaccharomyces japonicus yFS275]